MSSIIVIAALWTKSLKFWGGGGSGQKSFGNAKKENKKRIGEQLNYYLNMLLKPFFMGKKLEKTFFPTGTR